MENTNETWLDLPASPNRYQISNLGRIKSKEREVVRPNSSPYTKGETILTLRTNESGYLFADVRDDDGVKFTVYPHREVLEAFRPIKNMEDHYARHSDGDLNNNELSNLYWISKSQVAKENSNAEKAWVTRKELYGNGFKNK